MEHVRGGFKVEALALCVTGWLSSAAVPNPSGRMLLVAPAVTEMAEAYGYAPGSRPAAGLAMAALLGFGQTVAPFLTSSTMVRTLSATASRAMRCTSSVAASLACTRAIRNGCVLAGAAS